VTMAFSLPSDLLCSIPPGTVAFMIFDIHLSR
jgi:hypothetical protein